MLVSKLFAFFRYKQLMDESRKDQEIAAANHERELMMMQQKLHLRTDEAFSRFKTVCKLVTFLWFIFS